MPLEFEGKNKHGDKSDNWITGWNIRLPILHAIIGILFVVFYREHVLNIKTYGSLISGYYFFSTAFLLLAYKQLRDWRIFGVWFVIGIIQLIVYYYVKYIDDFEMARGTHVDYLKSLFFMLVAFQILRQLSLKLTDNEFIFFARSGTFFEEDRQVNWVDRVISITLFAVCVFSWQF
jgi:hypothetical protein